MKQPPVSPYANPYVAGVGLGLVLLAAFVLVGRGLGASGAFSSTMSWLTSLVAPGYAQANEYMSGYLGDGSSHPLKAWLVFEVVGVAAGALLSGILAGRARPLGGCLVDGVVGDGCHGFSSQDRRGQWLSWPAETMTKRSARPPTITRTGAMGVWMMRWVTASDWMTSGSRIPMKTTPTQKNAV
jgi:hypothetical protein